MLVSCCNIIAFAGRVAGVFLVASSYMVGAASVYGDREPLSIVVPTEAIGRMVERIGGNSVRVATLAGAGRNHETFSPGPRELLSLATADLYFSNDLPFERALIPRFRSVAPDLEVVNIVASVERFVRQSIDECCDLQAGQIALSAEHTHRGVEDPHLWLSPTVLRAQVSSIAETLSRRVSPAAQAEIAARVEALNEEIETAERSIQEVLEHQPRRVFLVNHPALGYFARDFGMRQLFLEAEGRQPSPAKISDALRSARDAEVQAVFLQEGFSRSAAALIARELGLKAVVFDPLAGDPIEEMQRLAEAFGSSK